MNASEVVKLRTDLGWSQKRLADHLGVSQPTIFRIENGQPIPGPIERLLQQLAASREAAA